MLRQLWTKLFPRRCPMCRTEVPRGSAGAVRAMGTWCCSQAHADAYACRLYEALDACQRRHAARHGVYVPRLTASPMDVAVSGMGQGEPRGCGTWFATCRIAGGL
jgi:hypothetical protein